MISGNVEKRIDELKGELATAKTALDRSRDIRLTECRNLEDELEAALAEAKLWKDAYTTAQGQIDAAENGLIALVDPAWKHDWIGDLVDGVKERQDSLLADNVALREADDAMSPRAYDLYVEWLDDCQHGFHHYCELKWRASKNA